MIARFGSLTMAQGLALLTRLVTDDGFRARFEQAPIAVLQEIGVPMASIAALREACITPRQLTDKHEPLHARQRLEADID